MHQFEQHPNLDRRVMLVVKYIASTSIKTASMCDLKGHDKLNKYSEDDISNCVRRLILEKKLVGSVQRDFLLTDWGLVCLSK